MRTQKKNYAEITDDGVRISFDKYDELVDKLTESSFQRDDWWPTLEEIEQYVKPNFALCFEFIVWILETGPKPVTDEEKASKKALNDLLIQKVEFFEDPKAEEQKEAESKEAAIQENEPEAVNTEGAVA